MASMVSELPDGEPDDSGLTPRQQAILRVIEETMADRGYPRAFAKLGTVSA